jgi:hypothetical protein
MVTGPAAAQTKSVPTGQSTVLTTYFSCDLRGGSIVPTAVAYHGTVATRESTAHRCGKPNHPVIEFIYTPKPGFKGRDEAFFYGGPNYRMTVIVQ